MTKLLNKKEPVMKQGVLEIFVLRLNCYIGTPPSLIKEGAGTYYNLAQLGVGKFFAGRVGGGGRGQV